MSFKVVSSPVPDYLRWVPLDGNATSGDTFYIGQIVKWGGDGVMPLGAASGTGDSSNKAIPAGIIRAFNDRYPVYDATNGLQYVTTAPAQANQVARNYIGQGGDHPIGDPWWFAQIELIYPHTLIEGQLFDAAHGTAITAFVNTTISTTGLRVTKGSATPFTPVADKCTLYCRSGANQGIYKITDNTSTTALDVDAAFPHDIAVNDSFVYVPVRKIGTSFAQFDAESLYIEAGASASLATNYWIIEVEKLDLRTAGKEVCHFRFGMDHFCALRA